ncbi:MAG: divergent polysaccharide deacetylase family protein [Candidatus Omnitrophota bacterium]|nr:divergent polysaccharide deacetylase family protein [Candidatus Omnitrophota bacterium]
MKKEKRYQIAITALVAVIILQWVFMSLGRPRPRLPVKKPPAAVPAAVVKGKIAIVLDDWGYNLNNLPLAASMKYPITASVLPNLSYSKKAARELHRRGWQIILHLPLEPHDRVRLEKDTIMASMDRTTVKDILDRDLAGIDYVMGVSGHMGSLATEDPAIMAVIFRDLLARQLFFLDSFVTSNSVCAQAARSVGLSFVKRDVFLDNRSDPEYIKKQLYQLKTKARIYGRAVGIGHDRRATLQVLKEMMPQLEREGYKFVYVSELAR